MDPSHNVLVLNADYRPLCYFPLSVCSWQDAVRAMFTGRVDVAEFYEEYIHSPSFSIKIPSVIVLKNFVSSFRYPPFTRRNLYLRDMFCCGYCGREGFIHGVRAGVALTMDHVHPKSKGGAKNWQNIISCCEGCNAKKGDKTLKEVGFNLRYKPYRPNMRELWQNSLKISSEASNVPAQWLTYITPEAV